MSADAPASLQRSVLGDAAEVESAVCTCMAVLTGAAVMRRGAAVGAIVGSIVGSGVGTKVGASVGTAVLLPPACVRA